MLSLNNLLESIDSLDSLESLDTPLSTDPIDSNHALTLLLSNSIINTNDHTRTNTCLSNMISTTSSSPFSTTSSTSTTLSMMSTSSSKRKKLPKKSPKNTKQELEDEPGIILKISSENINILEYPIFLKLFADKRKHRLTRSASFSTTSNSAMINNTSIKPVRKRSCNNYSSSNSSSNDDHVKACACCGTENSPQGILIQLTFNFYCYNHVIT